MVEEWNDEPGTEPLCFLCNNPLMFNDKPSADPFTQSRMIIQTPCGTYRYHFGCMQEYKREAEGWEKETGEKLSPMQFSQAIQQAQTNQEQEHLTDEENVFTNTFVNRESGGFASIPKDVLNRLSFEKAWAVVC